MALVITDYGLRQILWYFAHRQDLAIDYWQLGLFTNDVNPTRESVVADFVEPVWSGYERVQLTRADWTYPGIVDGVASCYWGDSLTEFVPGSSGPFPVLGYFVTDRPGTGLLWAERFADAQAATPLAPARLRPMLRVRNWSG